MISLLFAVTGGIFRRLWGGAGSIIPYFNILKRYLFAPFLGFFLGFVTTGSWQQGLACLIGLTALVLNPWHSKGQGMGADGTTTLTSAVAYMSLSYAFFVFVWALLCFMTFGYFGVWNFALAFAPLSGLLVSIPYMFGWYIWPAKNKISILYIGKSKDPNSLNEPVYFIESPTAIGEIGILFIICGTMSFILGG